jgi:hypothetical protein
MILDEENLFSDDQAITITADSENIIQLPKRSNFGQPLRILVQVTTTFVGATSLAVDIETDATAAFGSAATIHTGAVVLLASLVAGYSFDISFMPRENEEFVRLEYTADTTFSAGAITAGIIFDEQSNKILNPPA